MSYSASSDTAVPDDDRPLSEQDGTALVAAVRKCIRQSDSRHRRWRAEASECFRMVAGDQWRDEEEEALRKDGRPPVTFNRLGTLVDAVCGSQVNNRQETKFKPRTVDDQGKADNLQGALKWVRDRTDAEDEESEAFRDAVICGMGWLVNRVDYTDDPQGKIVKDRVSPMEMRWGPARKKNLADARWKAHVKRMPRDEVEAMWPGFSGGPGSANLSGSEIDSGGHPSRDEYAEGEEDELETADDTVEVVEYQWRETYRVYAVHTPTGIVHMDEYKWGKMRELAGDKPPRAVALGRSRWYRCVVAGEEVLQACEPCPDPEDSSYHCITGKRDEKRGEWYGLIRSLIDPQRWANKWLSQSLHILNTSAKSGVLAEEGAIEDVSRFEQDYAKPGTVSVVTPGSLTSGRVQPKQAPAMPAGFYQLLQFAIASIPDLSGINREIMGTADREQAGILEAQRKQAAQAVIAAFFDSLRLYYKRDGRQMARLIKAYIPETVQIRILREDGNPQLITTPEIPDVMMYDIVVDEAPASPNQKTEVWQVMGPALPGLVKMGIPPQAWVELLRYSPLPEAVVGKIGKILEQQAQAAAQQPNPEEQKMQAEMAIKQQEVGLKMEVEQMKAAMQQQAHEQKMQLEAFMAQVEMMKAQMGLRHDFIASQQKLESNAAMQEQRLQAARAASAQRAESRPN